MILAVAGSTISGNAEVVHFLVLARRWIGVVLPVARWWRPQPGAELQRRSA